MPKGRGQQVKKCRICGVKFEPVRSLQLACSMECAIGHANKITEKKQREKEIEERRELKARKEKLKTRSDWMKEAQIAFNNYIRERDKDRPCICCGQPLGTNSVGGGFDCGHYRSVGSAPHLRFDERNAHGQTKQCNRWGAGRAVDYRLGLIARIGMDAVAALESDQSVKKYTIDELKAIKAEYKQKLKELQRIAA